ncbi:lipopolysaccharide biosynthesis protein [Qipengyuania sp. CAU 1752]
MGAVARPERQAAAIQLVGAGFSVLTILILARGFGATMAGHYAVVSHTVLFASTLALFGSDQMVARAISAELAVDQPNSAYAALRHYGQWIAGGMVMVGAILLLVSDHFGQFGFPALPLWYLPATVLVFTLLRFASAALRGALSLRMSQATLALQRVALVFALLGFVFFDDITSFAPVGTAYLASIIFATLVACILLARLIGSWAGQARARFVSRAPDAYSIGLSGILISATGWAEVAVLGYWMDAASMGIFRVCVQIALPLNLVYLAYVISVGPGYAQLLARGEYAAAWHRHRADRRLLLAFGMPVCVLLIVFAEPLLGLLGDEFRPGRWPLIILAATALFNMATATASTMLNMAHREDVFRRLTIASVVVSALCIAFLIPRFGMLGAAISVALGVAIREGGAYIAARRILPRQDEQKRDY